MSIYALKSRFQDLLRPLVRRLQAAGITANQVTVLAMLLSLLVAALVWWHGPARPLLYLLLPGWMFLRMALNAIDGMLAREFGVDMHVVTTDVAAARNLMLAVERCHLSVETMVAAPYAAGLSVIADDEADIGAALIDMGAGTTTVSLFSGGRFTHCDGFALGGNHVTMDLARGLNAQWTQGGLMYAMPFR